MISSMFFAIIPDSRFAIFMPCEPIGVLTAGQLATEVFMRHYDIKKMPKMGQSVDFIFDNRLLKLYRMPSSSRAYPMQLEKKAEFYRIMFDELI